MLNTKYIGNNNDYIDLLKSILQQVYEIFRYVKELASAAMLCFISNVHHKLNQQYGL